MKRKLAIILLSVLLFTALSLFAVACENNDYDKNNKDDTSENVGEVEDEDSGNIEDKAYAVTFEVDEHITITVGDVEGNIAYSLDGNGKGTKDGTGSVVFKVNYADGFECYDKIELSPDTAYDGFYEVGGAYIITKISGDITVSISSRAVTDMPDFAADGEYNMPVMVINTKSAAPILDKENYVNCQVTVTNTQEKFTLTEVTAGIRGRGNSTWHMPKKPYKLKFDSKVDLFGNGSAKKWTLIANYDDKSMLRNYLAYAIGGQFEDIGEYTTKTQFVELYLNGSYEGVYLVCEQTEVGKTRVNIEDNINKYSPENIGYLLELDGHSLSDVEDLDFFMSNDLPFAIKSPEYDDLPDISLFSPYVEYIKGYMNDMFAVLENGTYEEICEYIDVNTFAESYIVHELFKSVDVGYLSFFVFKKENDNHLYCGPLWDFDISAGNCDYNADCIDPENLFSKENNIWYKNLLNHEEFVSLVSEKLASYERTVRDTLDSVNQLATDFAASYDRNFERWQILGEYVWPNTPELVAIDSWQGQIEYLTDWLTKSLDYLLLIY